MRTTPRKVAVIVGSLRAGSFSRMAAKALVGLAPGLELEIVEIGDLPLYNQDKDGADAPPSYAPFRDKIKAMDAVLFVTPEYNRSLPAVLKNAIDVGSRPYGHSAWKGKPGAIMSITPGALGAFGANHHLRQSLVFLDVPTLQQPEAYISNAATLFDSEGALVKEETRKFFTTFMTAFAAWIEANSPARAD